MTSTTTARDSASRALLDDDEDGAGVDGARDVLVAVVTFAGRDERGAFDDGATVVVNSRFGVDATPASARARRRGGGGSAQ
ncbi:MAG: hypothetical protein U0169_03365 [Polyangiaceae bacterium]